MGRDLTATEQRHVAVAHEHMAAVVAASKDPAATPRLAALLADDFTWQTPSSDPARGTLRNRDLYLAVVGNPAFVPEPERFVDLELKILATTAQGSRVAGEAQSYSVRRDGTIYHNHYHQLWVFDDAGKISEYRIYDDSEHVASVHGESNIKVVRDFLDYLSSGNAAAAAALAAEDLSWALRTSGAGERILDKNTAFALIADARGQAALSLIAPLPDGITTQGERVVVEAEARTDGGSGDIVQAEWRQFVFTMSQCRIQTIREYIYPEASHWFLSTPADG
ncbi:MAG: hypothetical protein JWM91_2304 [Rhodospirillales bacterium]|nr:hypothetical protein [Rhodospirillales bacterium]